MPPRHNGFALLTAMWVLVVLLIMVGGFAVLAHSEIEVAHNYAGQAGARWAAHAGLRDAEGQLITLAAQPYTALGGPQLVSSGPSTTGALGNATYTLTIQDEAGKVNINTASATLLTAFFSADIAANIITWRSASTANAGGADDTYYTGLTPPYHCRYAPFATVDELLLVKGVTPDLLSQRVTADGLTLRDLLTTASFDYNTDVTGKARNNINTMPRADLATLLNLPASAIPNRRAYSSPADLLSLQGMTSRKLATVYDKLTTTTNRVLPGLVNLNTASAEVLAALPGMDATTAQAVVQFRTTNGEFTDVGQLLTVSGISPTLFRVVAGSLTVRSTLFRVRATGQSGDGLSATVSCVLQTSTSNGSTSIRTLYWNG